MTGLLPVLRRYANEQTGSVRVEPERCDLCSEPIPADHRHVLERSSRSIQCVCPACAILFVSPEASRGRYRLIPDRRLRLDGWNISDQEWERLSIPVTLACIVVRAETGNPTAFYPSPMEAVEAPVDATLWHQWQQCHPVLSDMAPDVEVLLLNRARGAHQTFLVPIDDSFRLVALVRRNWRGLSGGLELRKAIDRYFVHVAERAVVVTRRA